MQGGLKVNVLSLCDGMSCGRIALEEAGIKVDNYYAAEIKTVAKKVTMDNYPDTIQIGDVNDISYENGVLKTEKGEYKVNFDLVIFGSPCQSFSAAMKADMRVGLEDKVRSGLFFECHRILKEVNPKYFLLENVGSMRKSDVEILTKFMGVEPVRIDAKDFGPAIRNRYYWTNIPVDKWEAHGTELQDTLDNGWTNRDRARCLLVSDSRPLTTPCKMFHRYYSSGFTTLIFKSEKHYKDCIAEYKRLKGSKDKLTAKDLDGYTGNVFDGVRYMNQNELEKCHGIPSGYTKCLTRNQAADVIGDGWSVPVIVHIFGGLK